MKKVLNSTKEPIPETVESGSVIKGVQICPLGKWPNGEVMQDCSKETTYMVSVGIILRVPPNRE